MESGKIPQERGRSVPGLNRTPPSPLDWRHDTAPQRLPRRCMGYINCCRCTECVKREKDAAEYGFTPSGKINYPPPPAQPWEHKNAA